MKTKSSRWLYVLAGFLILIFAGLIYAWSVLSAPIAEEFPDWSNSQLSLTFTLVMIVFCVGQLICGFLGDRIRPRTNVWVAAILFAAGFTLTAGTHSLPGLYLYFGVMCGLASGLAYNAVMSSVIKWFPDKQGLVSGILLMGFGMGSFLVGKVFRACTPDMIGAWRQSFLIIGIVIFAVLAVSGFFIKKPETTAAEKAKISALSADIPPKQMLRGVPFWVFYVWAIALSAAGLCVISQGSGIAKEVSAGLSPGSIATLVGLISIFNGVGRVVMGSMFDRFGRRITMISICLVMLLAGLSTVMALKSFQLPLLVAGFVLAGLAYGGAPLCSSAYISRYYGQKYYAINFPLVNTNLILASFGSTIAGMLFDRTSSFVVVMLLVIALSALGFLLCLWLNAYDKKGAKK